MRGEKIKNNEKDGERGTKGRGQNQNPIPGQTLTRPHLAVPCCPPTVPSLSPPRVPTASCRSDVRSSGGCSAPSARPRCPTATCSSSTSSRWALGGFWGVCGRAGVTPVSPRCPLVSPGLCLCPLGHLGVPWAVPTPNGSFPVSLSAVPLSPPW